MSLTRITDLNIERFELNASPKRSFSSSSISGVTGSVTLFADNSSAIADVLTTNSAGTFFNDAAIENTRSAAGLALASGNATSAVRQYLDVVNATSQSVRANKRQEVIRSKPGTKLNKNFMKKSVVQNTLFPYYKHKYPTCDWAFTNYNSINFVTGSGLPTDSVLIYPAGTGTFADENTNAYAPEDGFTFDFYINPRYTQFEDGKDFKAGTILHMSSCYAISLHTGSTVGNDGRINAFRVMLQLSQSAEIPPSQFAFNASNITTPSDIDSGFVFASSDNSLKLNTWHHVAFRWGGLAFQGGTGSIVIDGGIDKKFEISSSSVMQSSITTLGGPGDPDALFIGNFYEGNNTGTNQIAGFFNSNAARDEGVMLFNENLTQDPTDYSFAHPLNAELHDIKIYNEYRSLKAIKSNAVTGSSLEQSLKFYLPPFFVKETKARNVLQTPFASTPGKTNDPFNVALSFGLGGLSVNLENYTRDFVTGQYPRLLNLSSSTINTDFQEEGRDANYILYTNSSHAKRNLTILPNDNGKFYPNFSLVASGTSLPVPLSGSAEDKFVDFYGIRNETLVSLKNMVDMQYRPAFTATGDIETGSPFHEMVVGDPENVDPGVAPGNILTVLQRTRDNSSNEIAIFDISNMFYGDRIRPGTLVLSDPSVTGSAGNMSVTVKDNGRGSLYRADSNSDHATWSNVGNVLYEEGLVIIKTPNLPFFGKDSFSVKFQGDRTVYVLEVNIPAERSTADISTNPAFKALKPTDYANELSDRFCYLTGVQLHDDNLNVIMRVNLAQPVVKRVEDRLVIRARLDF
jgi:hypothetical protein